MSNMLAIARKELASYFTSPIGVKQLIPGWGGGDIPTPEDIASAL